jgi:hypothetical protein
VFKIERTGVGNVEIWQRFDDDELEYQERLMALLTPEEFDELHDAIVLERRAACSR